MNNLNCIGFLISIICHIPGISLSCGAGAVWRGVGGVRAAEGDSGHRLLLLLEPGQAGGQQDQGRLHPPAGHRHHALRR